MFAPWRSQSSSRKHGYPITGNLFILPIIEDAANVLVGKLEKSADNGKQINHRKPLNLVRESGESNYIFMHVYEEIKEGT